MALKNTYSLSNMVQNLNHFSFCALTDKSNIVSQQLELEFLKNLSEFSYEIEKLDY